eukprot:2279404-Amphidinium_carterae.2
METCRENLELLETHVSLRTITCVRDACKQGKKGKQSLRRPTTLGNDTSQSSGRQLQSPSTLLDLPSAELCHLRGSGTSIECILTA